MIKQIKQKLIKDTSYHICWLIVPIIQRILAFGGMIYINNHYIHLEGVAFILYCIILVVLLSIANFPINELENEMIIKNYENAEKYYEEYNNNRNILQQSDGKTVSISKAKNKINSTDGLLYFGIISCICVEILYYVIGPVTPVELVVFTSIELILITILIRYNYSKIICIKFIDDDTIEFSNKKQKCYIKINDINSVSFHGNDIELLINGEEIHFNVTFDYDFVDIFKVIVTKCDTKIGERLKLAFYKDKYVREGIGENDEVSLHKVMRNNSSKFIYWITQIIQFILVMSGVVFLGVLYDINEDNLIRLSFPVSLILFVLAQIPLMLIMRKENKRSEKT